jgi:membrane-associated protease RseP (regulator of RpoE activity)
VESIEQSQRVYAPDRLADEPARGAPVQTRGRSAGRILFHLALLAATALTTTFMGALLSLDVSIAEDATFLAVVAAVLTPIVSDGIYLLSGLVFSFTLLTILGAHELGHYLACRYYRIDASLPYFIPAPPPILIGTFGAFIRIRSPFTTRRALFDVGVAGPIAGFVFAIPAAIVGLAFAAPASGASVEGALVFHDPLLFILMQRSIGLPSAIEWNPIYFAAWIGVFATGLNLIPVGQLDGGHAVYALFGNRGHRALSIVFFAAVTVLAAVAFLRYGSPVWFLYVLILGLLAFRRHPPTLMTEGDIGWSRRLVAALVALIFLLSFMPFPITES